MKEKLQGALGVFGFFLWYLITFILTFAPILVLDFNLIIDLFIIAVVLFVPLIGSFVQFILWVWSFFVVIHGPIDILAIVYFITATIYVLTTLIPFVLALFTNKDKR